jgi:hypothetical protein
LIVAGVHAPEIPFVEVAGSDGAALPWQSGPICENTGGTCDVIVILKVAVSAHKPAVGVKVYVVVPGVAVLIVEGLHVPVIPFVEVTGRVGALEF